MVRSRNIWQLSIPSELPFIIVPRRGYTKREVGHDVLLEYILGWPLESYCDLTMMLS